LLVLLLALLQAPIGGCVVEQLLLRLIGRRCIDASAEGFELSFCVSEERPPHH
jgi:hypothetical protein